MKNTIRINYEKKIITYDREFAKQITNPYSDEFKKLQEVRAAYPNFSVKRHTIRKNENKETYKGLTYDYMYNYIVLHEMSAEREKVLKEFEELKLISECHALGKRYSTIKKWFLNKYPAVKEFGIDKEENTDNANAA